MLYREVYLALDVPLDRRFTALQQSYLAGWGMTPRGHLNKDGTRNLHLTLALLAGDFRGTEISGLFYSREIRQALSRLGETLLIKGIGGAIEYPKGPEGEAAFQDSLHVPVLDEKKQVRALTSPVPCSALEMKCNSVLWLSVESTPELLSLRLALQERLDALEIKHNIGSGTFAPHITLGSASLSRPKYDSHKHAKEATLVACDGDPRISREIPHKGVVAQSGSLIISRLNVPSPSRSMAGRLT